MMPSQLLPNLSANLLCARLYSEAKLLDVHNESRPECKHNVLVLMQATLQGLSHAHVNHCQSQTRGHTLSKVQGH